MSLGDVISASLSQPRLVNTSRLRLTKTVRLDCTNKLHRLQQEYGEYLSAQDS